MNCRVYGVDNKIDALKYLSNNYNFIYANIGDKDNEILYPVGESPVKLSFFSHVNKTVKCGGNVYFTEYRDGLNDEMREVIIDDTIHLFISRNDSDSAMHATLDKKNLGKLFYQLSFLNKVYHEKNIYLGEECISFNNIKDEDVRNVEEQFCFWFSVVETLKLLNCDISQINIESFQYEDYRNLELLKRAILDKEDISQNHELDLITKATFGPYTVLLIAKKLDNGKYRLYDFFKLREDMIFAIDDKRGNKQVIPIFSAVIHRGDFDSIVNLDYEHFIVSYEEAARFNRNISNQANNDVLAMVNTFDKSVQKDVRLLKYAFQLTDWILSLPEKENLEFVYRLNKLQIIKRLNGQFTKEEKKLLIDISEADVPSHAKWAANLLLEDYDRASRYWEKMNEQDKKAYKKYPIYYFENQRKNL